MDAREAMLAEVSRHCDVVERLSMIPPSAKGRGLYFRSIETALTRAGRIDRYHALFPERFAAVLWHPVSEFLVRLAVGGALLTTPERVHEGMFEIGRRNAVVFAESLLGRTLLRLLSRDPKRLLQQASAGRRQSLNYGRWTLEFPEPRTAVMTMDEEYLYIESYLLGAAQGTFDAVGVPVRTEVTMDDRFRGRHILNW
ncbi:MAG TPA: TIGR02265 family protein [Polyangiaceae bacterium]|nr:TIGR02265 family protein [Polyangiaceae bacterium]